MKNCFYVYLLLDPRRLYIPFYIGKGKGKRWKQHFRDSNGKNTLKKDVIATIKSAGLTPGVMLWATDLTEDEAFRIERELISRFGRRDLRQGFLTNLTSGGGGVSGKVYSEAERCRLRERMTGCANPMYGKTHDQDARNQIAKARRECAAKGLPYRHSAEWRQSLREDNAGGKATAKPLCQIGSDGKVLKEWPSANAAAKALGMRKGNVAWVAKTSSHRTAGGWWWRPAGSPDIIDGVLTDHAALRAKLIAPHLVKAVAQIDPNDNRQIRVWSSFREASAQCHVNYPALWSAARDGRLFAGYYWKPVD